MARASYLVFSALMLALATCVRSQFFADLFQGFQPFETSRPTLKQIYEQTTRRIKAGQSRGNYNRQTTRVITESTTKSYENDQKLYPPAIAIEYETGRRKTTYNNAYTTTVRPKKKDSSRIINSNKRDQATQSDFNYNAKENYDGKINSISDYKTQKPSYDRNPEYHFNNYYTTHNPLINRPGVKPAVVDNRPPITNRPVTKRPNYGTNPRPKEEDSIAFPEDDMEPDIIIGPDEDNMSAVEKKRYIELSERMCDKYKSLTTRAVQAIPLLPSPEPVRVNVTACTPTTVPLVVGGKVVGIREFPHMALLGWRKLQGPGYSWKCGGSLVSEQFILTAAHCTYQDRDNAVVNGPPAAVQLGSSYLDDPGALVVKVASVTRHPKYKQPRSYFDLAVVKMVNAVKFSEVIKPACLGVPPAVGKSIIATGWGRTEYGGEQSHELRSVSLPVWAMPRCQEVLGTSRKLPDGPSPDSQVCAGEERGGKDTCQGDSGGPAQVQDGCTWRVVAVTSLGRSCGAAETPGLYAKVHRAFVASQVFGAQKNAGSSQNWNSNGQSGDNNGQNWNNQNNNGQNNGNNNIRNNGNTNSANYGNNNGQYGYNNGQNYGNNGQNYDDNSQNYGDTKITERPSFNRPQYTTTTSRAEILNYNNNGYNQGGQNYNPRKPDNNGQNYGGDSNYGNNNRQQSDYNNYNQGQSQNSYTTQRPNRYDSSGIRYNNNNKNGRQDSINEYTTRRTNNSYDNRGNMNSDYSNNNYNTQNSNNNRNQSNNNGNYGSNNGNINRRPSDSYTVSRPWWL